MKSRLQPDTGRDALVSAMRKRVAVMGILNVTPDSFSDGGCFFDVDSAVAHALAMIADGADVIDVGGESTRPGADEVTAAEELRRVIPVIEKLSAVTAVPVSVDTRKSEVAEAALRAGASVVNDVSGLTYDEKIASMAARHGAALILMHMRGTPKDMQADPRYQNVVREVIESLRLSVDRARRAGVAEDRIIIDPGIGFGKTAAHNLEILNRLEEFRTLGLPLCIGTSRKSFIGAVLGRPDPSDRLAGTIATCVMAVMKGARMVRVHDVRETCRAVRMTEAVLASRG